MINSEKRVVMKKGKKVVTKKGKFVLALSKKIYNLLKPFSKKIEVAGSIRRKVENPIDIDVVLIPKDKDKIRSVLEKKGKFLQGGEKRLAFKIEGVKVEIYFTTFESWGASFFTYTGPVGESIGLRKIAKGKGLLLNQYGLYKKGKSIAGRTEKSIFDALGRKLKVPHMRGL